MNEVEEKDLVGKDQKRQYKEEGRRGRRRKNLSFPGPVMSQYICFKSKTNKQTATGDNKKRVVKNKDVDEKDKFEVQKERRREAKEKQCHGGQKKSVNGLTFKNGIQLSLANFDIK